MGAGFQVIPVLDVMGGRAVHAVGGERARYRPLRSILHPGHDPRELARALRDVLGLRTLYLADLDAITNRQGDPSLYENLAALGLELWLDAGLRDEGDLAPLPRFEGLRVIAGLETLRGPGALSGILNHFGPDGVIVSLDLREGRPLSASPEVWPDPGPLGIARAVIERGGHRLLLLDLARVGNGSGTGTEHLLTSLHAEFPHVQIVVGGGVAGAEDAREARARGASAVLVGSAIHDGRIDRNALGRINA